MKKNKKSYRISTKGLSFYMPEGSTIQQVEIEQASSTAGHVEPINDDWR